MLASQVVLVAKNPPANAEDTRDMGLIPALGIPLEEEIATTPLFLPENSMDRRICWAIVHGATESDTTKRLSTHTHIMHVNTVLSINSQFFQRQRAYALSSSCINTRTISIVQCLSGDSVLPQGTITNCSVMETPLKVQLYLLIQPPYLHGDTLTFEKYFHFPSLLRMRLKEILKLEST